MAGTFLRRQRGAHVCETPPFAAIGDVWRCDSCGTRWTSYAPVFPARGQVRAGAHWKRRYWPWPK